MERLGKLRGRLDRLAFIATALRGAKVVQPLRPARFAQFVSDARKTKFGPHLALMYHAAARPEKEAIVEYDPTGCVKRLTWGALDATINRLGNALIARGLCGDARHVGVMLPNCTEYLVVQQTLGRIGGTAVQIGYRLKAPEIAFILENSDPAITIVHADYLPALLAARAQSGTGGPLIVVGGEVDTGPGSGVLIETWDGALAAGAPEVPPRLRGGGDDGGAIVYTSGTTGKPKGAKRAWNKTAYESVADLIQQVGMRADDRHLVPCPLYHSAAPGFVQMLFTVGATIVLQDHWDPEQCLSIIQCERITCTMMVPTMLIRICALPAPILASYDTSSLRWVVSAAAPLTTAAARRFMDQFGPVLWNFYGATETGLVTLAGPGDHLTRPGTIGRAMRGARIRLLDDAGKDVPPGHVGELYTHNPMLMSGYHDDDDATTAASRDGYVSVGDVARVDDDGYYYLETRKHDMVISGGVNIYPREIEDHLATHPAILEAAVIGTPDPDWGESLRAFVVLREGAQLDDTAVINFCKALADYKCPRKVTFLPELPRNPTGKVLKRELRELA